MVDLSVFDSRSPNRYRFSLAHELAHVILHREVYAQLQFSSLAEWKRVVRSLSERDREWLEWQAYNFAGLMLVPRDALEDRLAEGVRTAVEEGVDVRAFPDLSKAYICTWLGRQFEVSAQVIEKRLDRDGLWPPEEAAP